LRQLLLLGALAVSCCAQSLGTFTVRGDANPYLAGEPNGATCCSGPFLSTPLDLVPDQAPVQVTGFHPGDILTFSASGSMSYGGGAPTDPTDGRSFTTTTMGTSGNFTITVADYKGPFNALVGVFLAGGQPATKPAMLDFTGSGLGTSFTSLSPGIGQVFFVGDGLTGAGTGTAQRFTVPAGATALYLGGMDGYSFVGNTGSFTVTVTEVGAIQTSPVPALSTLGLIVLGILVVGLAARMLGRRPATT
jgi:hypothetical protein